MPHASIRAAVAVKQAIRSDSALLLRLGAATDACVATFRTRGRVLFRGNGGSAAEASHVNASFLTAVANDYEYDHAFSGLTTAMARPGDVLFLLSASGNSRNVLTAAVAGKKAGRTQVARTGSRGGELGAPVDILLNIPGDDTPRIQEGHMLLGHLLCEDVERQLFGQPR